MQRKYHDLPDYWCSHWGRDWSTDRSSECRATFDSGQGRLWIDNLKLTSSLVTNDLVQVADLALANISASSINAPQANDVVHAFGESLTNITNSAVTGGTNAAVEAGEGATIQIYADSSFAGNPATVISSVASANDQAALASWEDALDGKRLLDDFAERGIQTWASPIDLLRLLWIRRDPRPVESDHWVETQKVLDLVVPGFDREPNGFLQTIFIQDGAHIEVVRHDQAVEVEFVVQQIRYDLAR